MLEAGKEQWPGSLQPQHSHEQQQDPFVQWSHHQKCKMLVWERGVLTPHCHLLSHPPGVLGGKLSSALPWDVSGHRHLHVGSSLGTGKEGSRSPSPAPCAPAAKLGQPSLHSRGFPVTPDHSGVLSRRRIPGSPSGCPRGVEQTKRCSQC